MACVLKAGASVRKAGKVQPVTSGHATLAVRNTASVWTASASASLDGRANTALSVNPSRGHIIWTKCPVKLLLTMQISNLTMIQVSYNSNLHVYKLSSASLNLIAHRNLTVK